MRVWRWPFGLVAATAAAAAIVFFATHASKQSETAPRSAAITPAETADGWTTPSDGLINEYPARRNNTSVGHLIEEIDQILKS